VTSILYKPPFVRVYILKDNKYEHKDYKEITLKEGGELDPDKIIDLPEKIPFRIGIMLRKRKHYDNSPLYRLVIIDKNEDKILPTSYELAEMKVKETESKMKKLKELLKKYREKYGEI